MMVQALAVLVTLSLIYRQVRLHAQANMVQTLERLAEKWDSENLLRARRAACRTYGRQNLTIGASEYEVLGFFEDLGLYYKLKVFEREVIWQRWSYFIEHYWAMYAPAVREMRASTKDQSWFELAEGICAACNGHSRERRLPFERTEHQISVFIKGELERIEDGSQTPRSADVPILPTSTGGRS